jgi:hypothetical protein
MLDIIIMILLVIAVRTKSETFKNFLTKLILFLMMAYICVVMFFDLNRDYSRITKKSLKMTSCQLRFNVDSTLEFVISNFIHWFDLDGNLKASESVVPYFAFIVVVTAFTGVKIHQRMKRHLKGEPKATPSVVFKDISRLDADESLPKLLKFLINYGFYKFGIEITLLVLISVILFRIDVISLFYMLLFLILLFCNRERSEKLWKISTICVTISIIVQCIVLALYIAILTCHDTLEDIKKELLEILRFFFQNLEVMYKNPAMILADFLLLTSMSCQVKLQLNL